MSPSPEQLTPHARPLRRRQHEVQFGLCEQHGVVLTGLSEPQAECLLQLARLPLPRWRERASRTGLGPEWQEQLLATLRERGLLSGSGHHPTASPARPAAARVLGRGRLAGPVTEALADAGLPAPAEQASGAATTRDAVTGEAARMLTVLLVAEAVPAAEACATAGRDGAVLPVVCTEHEVTVGPLVPSPEEAGDAPCLRCLDLHRRDRDPAWPALLSQAAPWTADTAPWVDLPAPLVPLAAGTVLLAARAWRDREPLPAGRSWTVSLPWPDLLTRTWVAHPACPCRQP